MRIGCLQLNSSADIQENITLIELLFREVKTQNIEFVFLPENAFAIGLSAPMSYLEDEHLGLQTIRKLAKLYQIWVLIGSLHVREAGQDKITNTSYLIDNEGTIKARYAKIHLFDVTLSKGEKYEESKYFTAGNQAVITHTPWGYLGLSICYDLRFPQLYRMYAENSVNFIAIPSCFAYTTGEKHWHTLLRARAIETSAYVIAPAQYGILGNGRKVYGHTLVVSPWGEILADGAWGTKWVICDLDPSLPETIRQKIPSSRHNPPFRLKII